MEYNIKQGGGSSRTKCAKENHLQIITKSSHLCFNRAQWKTKIKTDESYYTLKLG